MFLGLFVIGTVFNKTSNCRKAYIFNDDGSKVLKEFDDIKVCDYFELVEPDGSLVIDENNNYYFIATSNPLYDSNGDLFAFIYQGEGKDYSRHYKKAHNIKRL